MELGGGRGKEGQGYDEFFFLEVAEFAILPLLLRVPFFFFLPCRRVLWDHVRRTCVGDPSDLLQFLSIG
jgi:hypothetical protein